MAPIYALSTGDRISVSIAAACLLLGVYSVLYGWSARRKHQRVFGEERFREGLRFTQSAGKLSPRIRGLAIAKWIYLLGGGWLVCRQWLNLDSPPLLVVGAGLAMMGLVQFARESPPAAVIVLGSGTRTVALQEKLIGRDGVFPMRVISLLEGVDLKLVFGTKIPGECFRVSKDVDWRSVVFGFAKHVAVIVMDCRTLTDIVKEECEHVLERYPYKVVLIGDPNEARTCPVLTLDQPESCARFLRFLLNELETCPSPERPILYEYALLLKQEPKHQEAAELA